MKLKAFYQSLTGVSLAAVAFAAGAQTGVISSESGNHPSIPPADQTASGPTTDRNTSSSTSSRPDVSSTTTTQSATNQAPRKQRVAKHAQHKQVVSAAKPDSREASYRTQLRRCMGAPIDQRESCLDNAVSRHNRSG